MNYGPEYQLFHLFLNRLSLFLYYIMHSCLQIHKKNQMQMELTDTQKTHNILITENMTSDTGVLFILHLAKPGSSSTHDNRCFWRQNSPN